MNIQQFFIMYNASNFLVCFEFQSNWIDTDHQNSNVVVLLPRSPIADIVERVAFDDDDAWISCDMMSPGTDGSHGNDLMSDWDHVGDGDLMLSSSQNGLSDSQHLSSTFTSATVADVSHLNWLATDNELPERKRDDSETARPSIEAASVGLGLQQPDWFKQWLNEAGIQLSSHGSQHNQDQNVLTRATQDMRTKSSFNPLAYVLGDSYSRKFELSEKTVPTINDGSAIPRSFPGSCKDDDRGNVSMSDSASDCDQVNAEQELPSAETFFTKIVSKPTEYWLEVDAANKFRSCLPLSYWLCPSVVNSERGCDALSYWLCPTSMNAEVSDRLAVDTLDDIDSEMIRATQHFSPSIVDGFTCFVEKVLSSSANQWLSTDKSSRLSTLSTSCSTTPFKIGLFPTTYPLFSTIKS